MTVIAVTVISFTPVNVYFPAYNNEFIPAIHVKEICRVDASMTIALRKKGKKNPPRILGK